MGNLTRDVPVPLVYEGPPFTLVAGFGYSQLHMNANGDIVWENDLLGRWMEAIDLTSRAIPEPNSLLLLGSGALAMLGAIRRRFQEG